jgi:transcription antitermination factor NusG
MLQIEQAIVAGADLSPHNYLKEGQRCRVIGGVLAGLAGIVVKVNKTTRLVLQIDMLGQAASVEIGTDMIEPIEDNDGR